MIIIISMILSSHVLIFFDFYPSCIAQPGSYSIFYNVYLIMWTGILPNGLIFLFTLLTFRNVIKKKKSCSTTNENGYRTTKTCTKKRIPTYCCKSIDDNLDDVWTSNFIKYF